MAIYNVEFYNANPASIFTTAIGSMFTWNGPLTANGTAAITDNEAGSDGLTLDDDSAGGETARATATIGANTSTNSTVDAELLWTLRDTVTGLTFQVAQFEIEAGAATGFYTLSESPLIANRVYEVVAYDTNPNNAAGDIVFTYADFVSEPHIVSGTSGDDTIDASYAGDPQGDMVDSGAGTGPSGNGDVINAGSGNDSVAAGNGNDTVTGGGGNDTIDGGAGADTIYGDTNGATSTSEHLNWAGVDTDESSIAGGVTQNTGEMNVSVSFTNNGDNSPLYEVESTDTEYVGAGEPMSTTSGAYLYGNGLGATSTTIIDFAATAGSNLSDEVANVVFRINDIDAFNGNHLDVVTVNAYDADGNPVTVTITLPAGTNDTASGNTITAGNFLDSQAQASGSALIEIAGPVASIEIIYTNAEDTLTGGYTGTHAIWVTDIHFDTIVPSDGDDIISGGAGNDFIFGEGGDDTLTGGTGSDTMSGGTGNDTLNVAQGDTAIGGDGDDTFNLTDLGEAGSGTITITGGEGGETNGDTLNLNGLVDLSTLTISNPNDGAGGLSGSVTMLDGSVVNFSNIEHIICFTTGTRILTEFGERPIEDLRPGDMVFTRDNGLQPIRWISSRTVKGTGKFAPVSISPQSGFGGSRTLLVSPQHRLLYDGYRAELLMGQPEVLIAAKHLINDDTIRLAPQPEVTYFHMMFDRHEIVFAEGVVTESFHASDLGISAVSNRSRAELFEAFPALRSDTGAQGRTARRCLKRHEARLLVA
ncbi:MAG: Hint domain-containing protein [Paracoccaceae bacterium]